MTEPNEKQLDLFIKSHKKCNCTKIKHALTAHEFEFCLKQANRIKELILSHGWKLSTNYYRYLDRMDNACNAWDVENIPYLVLRSEFQEQQKEATLSLRR